MSSAYARRFPTLQAACCQWPAPWHFWTSAQSRTSTGLAPKRRRTKVIRLFHARVGIFEIGSWKLSVLSRSRYENPRQKAADLKPQIMSLRTTVADWP